MSMSNRMSAVVDLTREELLQSLGIPATELTGVEGVTFELTGTSLTGSDASDAPAVLIDLLRYEEQMVRWLSESEANAKQFVLDPMTTFQRVCDVPRELVDEIDRLNQQELGETGAFEETKEEEEDGASSIDAAAVTATTPPDLSVGWDFTSAVQQGAVNHRLQAVCDNGALPSTIDRTFNVEASGVKLTCTADLSPGCPQIGAPVADNPTLVLPISGKIKVKKFKVPLTTITIEGQVSLSMDLDLIGVTASAAGQDAITVELTEPDGDLFTALDLTQLTITFKPGPSLDPEDYATIILAAMNDFVASLNWPMTWTIEAQVPLPPQGIQGHLNYTVVSNTSDENLFGMMLSRETKTGSSSLDPQTVPDTSGCSAAFVVSNNAVLSGLATGLASLMNVPQSDFQVTDDYPAKMQLVADIKQSTDDFKYKIHSGDLYAYFDSQGRLYLYMSGKVKAGWMTFWAYQKVTAQAWFTFSADNGQLEIQVQWKANIPWWWWLVLPIIKVLVQIFGSGDGSTTIPIPGFDVVTVSSPAYLQIGGHWDAQPFHFRQPPLSPTPIIKALTVSQSLSANSGKFVFDFSEYGSKIEDYIVGVAYWFYQYSTSTDHQTQTVALSLTNTSIRGATVTVKPVATLYGQGHGIDTDASSLTLCCVAVIDKSDPGVTLKNDTASIPNGDSSDAIEVEDSETGTPQAILSGWSFEYFKDNDPNKEPKSHHVRTLQIGAELTAVSPDSVQIQSDAVMHDDSGNNAIASINGGVIKLGSSEGSLVLAKVTPAPPDLQDTNSNYPVHFDASLSQAAVFLQSYRVHYDSDDRDIRIVGGGTPNWTVSGSTVTLTKPHALIGDGNTGYDKHTQEDSSSHVGFVVIGIVDQG